LSCKAKWLCLLTPLLLRLVLFGIAAAGRADAGPTAGGGGAATAARTPAAGAGAGSGAGAGAAAGVAAPGAACAVLEVAVSISPSGAQSTPAVKVAPGIPIAVSLPPRHL
jgi:hypothetical protein